MHLGSSSPQRALKEKGSREGVAKFFKLSRRIKKKGGRLRYQSTLSGRTTGETTSEAKNAGNTESRNEEKNL